MTPASIHIPEEYAQSIIAMHSQKGYDWLQRLPTLLTTYGERWELTLGTPFTNLSYHFVISARQNNGKDVVLKLCAPTQEFAAEIAALQHFDGIGMVRLLKKDGKDEIMLLERLMPGSSLTSISDDTQATAIAIQVMRQLWRPVSTNFPFPTIAQWSQDLTHLRHYYQGGTGPFPEALVTEAERLYADLVTSMADPVLLLGDLHHDNILASKGSEWLAIDPKGVIGEPAYEIGAFLRNPRPIIAQTRDLPQLFKRRIDQFSAELGIDRSRIRGWCLYEAFLSAWWNVEDFGALQSNDLCCAEAFAAIPE